MPYDQNLEARPAPDPIRSYRDAAKELDLSLITFRRRVLPQIPIVLMSPRRRGVRQSVIDAYKESQTRPGGSYANGEAES